MRIIEAGNVNDAWAQALPLVRKYGESQGSRAGGVLAAPWPVVTVYERPTERVLLDPVRDANPFFHLFESIWLLAGRNDAEWLDQWVRDFSHRFAEDDGTLHGSYGHRWRSAWDFDQLGTVVQRLRRDPTDRRVVIQMWDPVYDLIGPDEEDGEWPEREPRDLPCNLLVMPRIRREHKIRGGEQTYDEVLDITVACRSNDVVWGCYGANAVQFSMLQEYLAAAIGVEVGRYYQVSNNWHIYESELNRLDERAGGVHRPEPAPHYPGTYPMVTVPSEFLADCERFCVSPLTSIYGNRWFADVAVPMAAVHAEWRGKRREQAVASADRIKAPDWRLAAQRWMARRLDK